MRFILPLAILAVLFSTLLAVPPTARAEEIQFGTVQFENDYDGFVTVRLYHADALDRVFATWSFSPEELARLTLKGKDFTIGGDWIIDIRFSNGVTSQRRLVYKVGTQSGGVWTIGATNVYNGSK